MKASGVADSPIRRPDEDLLEMAIYARNLAEFIVTTEPPFTIGIYGEWGSGKTSFVRLVEHFLCQAMTQSGAQPVRFIPFTAWPYRTADEMWRALVLTIARKLYDVPDPVVDGGAAATPEALDNFQGLSRFLRSDAFVLRAPPKPPDPLADYKALVARLDRTQATIARDAGQVHGGGDERLIALAKVTAAALGTLSPLVAGLRGLLGFDEKIDLAELFHRDANETLRERIESVAEFQEVFRDLFATRAATERICIFIDDLDRTMPDVALDLLEAVRIFLGEARATFIVAADENLIGQGLRLRYRDLLQGNAPEIQSFFDRKGREYFEKCIQLGIRVPQRTARQTHRFVSAQFPQWLPALDIIQTAIGDNPRRLKQYCNWLRYKYRVLGEPTRPAKAVGNAGEELAALLEKVVALHAWDSSAEGRLLGCLRRALAAPGTLGQVEGRLAAAQKLPADFDPSADLESEILALASSSSPLQRLLMSPPLLSEAPPLTVAILVELAEIAPDSETMLRSRDASFMRILEIAARQGLLSADRLLLDDFKRLVAIDQISPEILDRLQELAAEESWASQLLDLEKALQSGDPAAKSALAPASSAILSELEKLPDNTVTELCRLLLGPPGLSTLLREEVLLFSKVRDELPEPMDLLNPTLVQNLKQQDRYGTLARWALEEKLREEPRKADILSWLEIRIEAAQQLLKLRTFAKLDAFTHCWPDLARSLRTAPASLIALESQALEPQQAPPGLERLWDLYKCDDRLLAFLKLRPLFRDIPREEIERFLLLAQATEAHAPVVKASAQAAVSLPPAEDLEPSYEDVRITFQAAGAAYRITVKRSSAGNEQPAEAEIDLSLPKLQEAAAFLDRFNRAELVQRDVHPQLDFATQLRELGELLYRSVFRGAAQSEVAALLNQPTSWRFLWDFDEAPKLMALPWECLYAPPPVRSFLALTKKYSLVRSLPAGPATFERTFAPPLRLLAVFPSPRDLAPLNGQGEEEILRRCVAEGRGQIQLDVLRPRKATWEKLKERIDTFRPHLLHFVGHGVVLGDTATLVLEDAQGGARPLEASEMATLLRDSQLSLAVLNACDTGLAVNVDAITSLAGALIQAGVPAVVGTTRKVPDDAALLFTREFYRSFLSGVAVEGAIVEARKALSIEKWDWSLYALFGGSADLGFLRLPRE